MVEHWLFLSLLTGLAVFLLAGALSPLESLSWWAGWSDALPPAGHREQNLTPPTSGPFVVYLAGIDSISGDVLTTKTQKLLAGLAAGAPNARIISSVFPYAPTGAPLLAGPRLFLRAWRFIDSIKRERKAGVLAYLINLRNFYQVLVSADHRYGPLFNAGAAGAILEALTAQGYELPASAPIIIIGYSGGAQVAMGAAEYLKAATGANLSVISIGGTMASSPGIAAVDRIDHFYGKRDRVEKFAALMFPERWPAFRHSHWNVAKAEGRIHFHLIGEMGHDGPSGYLGDRRDCDGEAFIAKTTRAVLTRLRAEANVALDQSIRNAQGA